MSFVTVAPIVIVNLFSWTSLTCYPNKNDTPISHFHNSGPFWLDDIGHCGYTTVNCSVFVKLFKAQSVSVCYSHVHMISA